MSISSISAAGLGQAVLSASTSSPLQQILQSLQQSLTSGNLPGANSAFQALQNVSQNSATATGTTLSSNSQFATDLATLGSALTSNDLSSAQSAFATLLGDLKNTATPAQTNEANASSQAVQLVSELLGTLNSSGSGTSVPSSDSTTSILASFYESKSGLNLLA